MIEPQPLPDDFARLLSRFDDGLQSGDKVDVDTESVDQNVCTQLGEAQEFLRLMESVWPRRGPKIQVHFADLHALPHRIGRFEIRRILGRGGVGIVYLARDPLLGRDVAIKVPRIEIVLTPQMRRRFLREAQTAALLNHPNIIPTLEVGDEGDLCFIVYPFCSGPTLTEWMRSHAITCLEAADLVERLADAMAHAHQRGVLHRDLKPSNILLEPPTGDRGQQQALSPRITDFGLAKVVDTDDLTGTGEILGTPAYMAPEQTLNPKEPTPACDIWALGVIFYELLAGDRPFPGATPVEIARAIQEKTPISPRRLKPRVPRDLETICLKCLAKEPGRRYASAFELKEDLSRFQRGLPVHARPVPMWERAWRWSRLHPARASLVGLILLVGVAAALGMWLYVARLGELVASAEREKDAEKREAHAKRQNAVLADLAAAEEARSRRLRYVGDIRASYQAIRDLNPMAAKLILDRWPGDNTADERGLEWFDLQRQIGPRPRKISLPPVVELDQKNQLAVEQSIRAFAMSPDCRFAANMRDGELDVYDLTTGKKFVVLKGPPSERRIHHSLAFSPNGRVLAAAYNRRSPDDSIHPAVALWDWRHNTPLAVVDFQLLPAASTMEVAFHPGGATLMVRTDADLTFHSVAKFPKEVMTFDGGPVRKATFSPDGEVIAVVNTKTKSVEIRTLPTLKARREIPWTNAERCEHLAFSNDGRMLAYGTREELSLWELQRLTSSNVGVSGARTPIASLCFSKNSEWLHVSAESDSLYIFSSRQPQSYVSHQLMSGVANLVADPDGRRLHLRTKQGSVRTVAANWPTEPESIDLREGRLYSLAFSPQGYYLATGGAGSRVHVFETQTLKSLRSLPSPSEVFFVAFSPGKGDMLFAGDFQGQIHRWNVPLWKSWPAYTGHTHRVGGLAFTPDGKHLLSMGWDKSCRLVRLKDGETDHVFEGPFELFSSMALAPHGNEFAWVGEGDGTLRIWDLETKSERIWPFVTKGRAVTYSPDGAWLASSDASGDLYLWDRHAKKLVKHVQAHKKGVRSMAFSPDGKVLASAGLDHVVKLHDAATFLELVTLHGPLDELRALKWSPDGRTLAAVGHDGHIWIWRNHQ